MSKKLILIAALTLALPAFADDAIPTPTCTKPELQTDANGKLKNVKELNGQANAYQTCVQAYIADRNKVADGLDAQSRANRKAANAAANEFNDFAGALTAAQKK
jgi:hypothetical protein